MMREILFRGKRIFEGDIVEYSIIILNRVVHKQLVEIVFKEGSFCMKDGDGIAHPMFNNTASVEIEIIGNIHDNPELMEVR